MNLDNFPQIFNGISEFSETFFSKATAHLNAEVKKALNYDSSTKFKYRRSKQILAKHA